MQPLSAIFHNLCSAQYISYLDYPLNLHAHVHQISSTLSIRMSISAYLFCWLTTLNRLYYCVKK